MISGAYIPSIGGATPFSSYLLLLLAYYGSEEWFSFFP